MYKVVIHFAGDKGKPIIKVFESPISARAYIDGFKEGIYTPGCSNVKITLDGKEILTERRFLMRTHGLWTEIKDWFDTRQRRVYCFLFGHMPSTLPVPVCPYCGKVGRI